MGSELVESWLKINPFLMDFLVDWVMGFLYVDLRFIQIDLNLLGWGVDSKINNVMLSSYCINYE